MTQIGYDVQMAANDCAKRIRAEATAGYMLGDGPMHNAFAAGVEWQKERPSTMSIVHDGVREIFDRERLELVFRQAAAKQGQAENVPVALMVSDLSSNQNDAFDEIRNAIATLGEGVAEMLKRQSELAACALRGADRGVATLKHLQEIGDNVRGVSGAIGDKFGVVLDAVRHVGETVEAVLDAVLVAENEPATRIVEERTEDASGLGKLWDDIPVTDLRPKDRPPTFRIEEVSNETLDILHSSGQLPTARYDEERKRRRDATRYNDEATRRYIVGMDLGKPGSDTTAHALVSDGEMVAVGTEGFQVWEGGSGVIVAWRGNLYRLIGRDLHPLRTKA